MLKRMIQMLKITHFNVFNIKSTKKYDKNFLLDVFRMGNLARCTFRFMKYGVFRGFAVVFFYKAFSHIAG